MALLLSTAAKKRPERRKTLNIFVTGNKITGYVSKENYPGTIHVEDAEIPEGFTTDFDVGKWLYIDGTITINPDYVKPEPVPEPEDEQFETQEMILDHEFRLSLLELGIEGGETA